MPPGLSHLSYLKTITGVLSNNFLKCPLNLIISGLDANVV